MIRLPNTGTYSLELVTAQNGAQVVVCYSDATSNTYVGGIQTTTIVSATTTAICSTPAASTVRDVDEINIKNTFAGSHTITVQVDANATNIPLVTAALLTDESLNYTHGSGWQCKDANGNTKTTPLTAMTSAQLAAIVSDETGSGALVFATSPTLVTPVLGTPASGDLRNCSLAVAPAIGGTTPAAGAFTTLNVISATVGVLGIVKNTDAVAGYSGFEYYNSSSVLKGYVGLESNAAANQHLRINSLTGTTNIYSSGTLVAAISATGLAVTGTISATSMQNTPVGSVTPSTGAFTTLSIGGSNAHSKFAESGANNFYDSLNAGETAWLPYIGRATTAEWRVKASGTPTAGMILSEVGLGVIGGIAATTTIKSSAGTVGAPSIYLSTDTTSGLYRVAANEIGIAISGSQVGSWASTGLAVTGAISATTSILSSGATSGIGYTTGAGGTVAQGAGSGKATGVTLAKVCGTITMDGASLAADTTVTFLLTMTGFTLNATDQFVLSHISVGTFGAYILNARYASATTMNIDVHNATPGALAEAIVIQYSLIRSVAA